MNRNLIGNLFPLLFDDEQGGGLGDVSEIPHGQSGDVEVMGRMDSSSDREGQGGDENSGGDDKGDESDKEEAPEIFEEEGEEKEKEEEKEEEEKEGKEEEEEFQGRPTLTDIKKVYPDIFKKFPDLRDVLFSEQKFREFFGTVDEAEEAAAKVGNFDLIESALLAGDSGPILEQLSNNAPESLELVIDNFLPSVMKQSQDLYLRATIPVIEQFLYTAYQHGKRTQDTNLMRSAQHAANFIFGKPEIPDPSRRGTGQPHPAEAQLQKERQEWARTRFSEASQEVSGEIDVELETEIMKGLDPDKKLSKRQRASLINDIKNEIDQTLSKDEAFGRQMRSLWQKAQTAGYPREQRASIKTAFLARAKALVPSVRTRLRAEWFGQTPPKESTDGKEKQNQSTHKTAIGQSGRPAGGGPKRPPSPDQVDWNKTSDMDLIEGRFHRKRG